MTSMLNMQDAQDVIEKVIILLPPTVPLNLLALPLDENADFCGYYWIIEMLIFTFRHKPWIKLVT